MSAAPLRKFILTPRLVLREIRMRDLPPFHELVRSEDVMKYWSEPHQGLITTKGYIQNMISAPTNGLLAFAIILPPFSFTANTSTTLMAIMTNEGTFIGHAGLWYEPPNNELVFMIDKSCWNRGYMTEVIAALLPVFWEFELGKVWANVDPENVASLRVLLRSGFEIVDNKTIQSSRGEHVSLRLELANPDLAGDEEQDREEGDNRRLQGSSRITTGLISQAVMKLSQSDPVGPGRHGGGG